MEKKPNLRFSNQNLSNKGQISEAKKSTQDGFRYSKKREQPNNSSKSENTSFRNNKSSASSKQQRFNFDKRPKPRSNNNNNNAPNTWSTENAECYAENFDFNDNATGTRLTKRQQEQHELHSVFSPGSKKQSLNHLLNFHYAAREKDQPVSYSKTGNNRCYARKPKYNKEHFLQANCQFVVRANYDYSGYIASPDLLVEWDKIEQIHVMSSEVSACPICLYPPVAGKMTKCGHLYCWTCILHYLTLSDKTWRKCPICYDAVHMTDLKSAIAKPHHSFNTGESVTFQLMRREKGSMIVTKASDPIINQSDYKIPLFTSINQGSLSKLLLAESDEILNILAREEEELQSQLYTNGIDCPENVFVEQALISLRERKIDVESKNIGQQENGKIEFLPAQNDEEMKNLDEKLKNLSLDVTSNEQQTNDFLIDEENDLTFKDIDIVPTSMCATNCYYFYQSIDGQPLFLNSINTRMLQEMYGSLEMCPKILIGKIVQKDSCSLTEDLRKRLKYLQHLPVSTQFNIVEIELCPPVVTKNILMHFKDELQHRRKERQRRERNERIREKQIFEFNERQLGKSLERSANIQIESNEQFPICGSGSSVDSIDFHSDHPPLVPVETSNFNSSAGASWSKMLSEPQTQSWPSLPSTSKAIYPVTRVQVSGQNMKQRTHRVSDSDDSLGAVASAEDYDAIQPTQFKLSNVIEMALENVHKNPSAGNDREGTGGKKKKNKNKKTLLFATGMTNYN
uniref:E3 ubiquitin-protein ligase RNF10 n=1 Tax=Corethrella appendiculata TaxID=1370023 RepID=U5ETB8_9DIPT